MHNQTRLTCTNSDIWFTLILIDGRPTTVTKAHTQTHIHHQMNTGDKPFALFYHIISNRTRFFFRTKITKVQKCLWTFVVLLLLLPRSSIFYLVLPLRFWALNSAAAAAHVCTLFAHTYIGLQWLKSTTVVQICVLWMRDREKTEEIFLTIINRCKINQFVSMSSVLLLCVFDLQFANQFLIKHKMKQIGFSHSIPFHS